MMRSLTSYFSRWKITPIWLGEDRMSRQHSLLRILALSNRQALPIERVVRLFAQEHWGLYRIQLDRLNAALSLHHDLLPSLSKYPDCLSEHSLLALRVASDLGNLERTWTDLLEWEQPINTDSARLWRHSRLYWILILLVATVISSFFLIGIVPTLLKISQEFQAIESENLFNRAILFSRIFLIGICLAGSLWLVQWLLRRFIPSVTLASLLPFRMSRSRLESSLLRLIAIHREAEIPLPDILQSLKQHHPNRSIRIRLQDALFKLEQGNSPWESLRSTGILSKQESIALSTLGDPQVEAWILKHCALAKREKIHFGSMRKDMWQQLLTTLLVASFVFVLAFALFNLLTESAQILANPRT